MKLMPIYLSIVLCILQVSANADSTVEINQLYWLAGEWIGEGREGDDGEVEGVARLYWTPPVEGSISLFFTWHAAASEHVHYAVNVFQQIESGVFGKGIHYGPDFENFEDHPWHLKAMRIGSNIAIFHCLDHCRSESVSFTLHDDGVLEERWKMDSEKNRPDWIVRYRRAD